MTDASQVIVVSPHGRIALRAYDHETISDCLWRYRIPPSSVLLRLEPLAGAGPPPSTELLSVSSEARVASVSAHGTVVAYVSRNTQMDSATASSRDIIDRDHFTTEWLAASDTDDPYRYNIVQLTPDDILTCAVESLERTFAPMADRLASARMVVGVSGGGDSNLLLAGMRRLELLKTCDLQPVMMLGIPDWDRQVRVAEEMCRAHGMALTVIAAAQAAELAGLDSVPAALHRFAENFPNSGKEFFGTWLLRRVLSAHAVNTGAHWVVIGGNREDTLAECLFMLSLGSAPLPFPARRIGAVTFVDPLYLLPKKVIDGGFPQQAIANYLNRDLSNDRGRSLFYYVVHLLQDAAPGFDVTLLEGLQQIAASREITWDGDLEDYTFRAASSDVKQRWAKVIGRMP